VLHVDVHSESVVLPIQMIVIFWVFIQYSGLCYVHRTVQPLSCNKKSVPVMYRSIRVVQLVADMEGGKKRA
jgi:hypothetical protein